VKSYMYARIRESIHACAPKFLSMGFYTHTCVYPSTKHTCIGKEVAYIHIHACMNTCTRAFVRTKPFRQRTCIKQPFTRHFTYNTNKQPFTRCHFTYNTNIYIHKRANLRFFFLEQKGSNPLKDAESDKFLAGFLGE
jgi:hypothetical protein